MLCDQKRSKCRQIWVSLLFYDQWSILNLLEDFPNLKLQHSKKNTASVLGNWATQNSRVWMAIVQIKRIGPGDMGVFPWCYAFCIRYTTSSWMPCAYKNLPLFTAGRPKPGSIHLHHHVHRRNNSLSSRHLTRINPLHKLVWLDLPGHIYPRASRTSFRHSPFLAHFSF